MLSRSIRILCMAALAGASGCLVSCAQNIGDIDLTQPDKIDVSLLDDGKPWWFLQTVVDVPPTTQFTYVGELSFPPNRIVWDVQENWLIAYNNYEFIAGGQTYSSTLAAGSNGAMPVDQQDYVGTSKSPYFGTPVAAYAILSHFDVERGYNPATGEQTNVISENTTDRPWYERQYIRVDWSNNGFGGFNFLSAGMGVGEFDPTQTLVSPVAYYPDQGAPADQPEITPNYIGIVNKLSYTAEVDTQASQYYGFQIDKCYDFTASIGTAAGDCGPGEVKVRLSFEKIPDTHDFAPKVFNDQDEMLFGVWQQERSVYDPQRGYLEANLAANQFAVMHHIWQKDHYQADPADSSGKTACDVNNFDGAPECVLPLNQRIPKPIVYYMNDSWPAYGDSVHQSMWVHASLMSQDYDDDMRSVVAAARRGGPSLKSDISGCSPTQIAGGYQSCSAICSPSDIQSEVSSNGASGSCPNLTVSDWMNAAGIPTPDPTQIVYNADGTIDYSGTKGLDYLAYPPDTRYLAPSQAGLEGVRPDTTMVKAPADASGMATSAGTICTAQDIVNGGCSVCNPSLQYCMGVGHVPYFVIPRMQLFCHNPVMPRVVTNSNGTVQVDKSDSFNPNSYDFSTLGDPDICDSRPDAQRVAQPLNPQMGDLRYHMLAWVQQPDDNSPGGIGEPAMDPVTGEIVTAHAYIYARAVEGWASYAADLVSVMEGWEPLADFLNGGITQDYIQAQVNGYATPGNPAAPGPPVFSGQLLANRLGTVANPSPAGQRVEQLIGEVASHKRDPGVDDWTVANWQRVTSIPAPSDPINHYAGFDLSQPLFDEVYKDLAPTYAGNSSTQIPPAITQSLSFGNMLAPAPVTTWNQQFTQTRRVLAEAHVLVDDEIEPTAVRLAQYYDNKFYTTNAVGQKVPSQANTCVNLWQSPSPNNPDSIVQQSSDYRTCVWELTRQEVLGNMWRSYSAHEVGHTFGQYHNFAGSTDALNYFDPYWNIRQENTIVVDPTAPAGSNSQYLAAELGAVPASTYPNDPNVGQPAVLAPEWMQAPAESSLAEGLREYQYTSIMDYNSKFNADFQGLGKYDHACHMFQYANQVEVFDPVMLPNVPKNAGPGSAAQCPLGSLTSSCTGGSSTPALAGNQVDDTLLVPFNRHYTYYPWLINNGLSIQGYGGKAKATPLAQAIQTMIHARRWVNFDDLTGANGTLPDSVTQAQDGLPASTLSASLMVPYRFCSDLYSNDENGGIGGEADCLWFDEGADAFEQANGFIQEYKLNYLFNNFKRDNQNFDPYDNGGAYMAHLWERNFAVLVTIYQQFFNDEFIVRYGNTTVDNNGNLEFQCVEGPTGTVQHVQGVQCGMDRMASAVATVDFFTKLLQTPTSDKYLLDPIAQTYCPSSYNLCQSDGFNPANQSDPTAVPINLLPGSSAKFDLSQFNLDEYGLEYMWNPTVIGIWRDKLLAIQAMSYPQSYIVGQLNSQPLSFLLSMNDLFFSDIEGSIGGLVADDPQWTPKLAVWAANPADPNHPPVTVYRNSKALQGLLAQPQGANGFGSPYNPWCPANSGSAFCSSNESSSTVFEEDPAALQAQGYSIYAMDPGPVYFEKLAAAYYAAVWLTAPIDNQNFIQSIRIGVKGNTYDAAQLAQFSCDDNSTCTPAAPSCADGTTGCTLSQNCPSDGSLCAPRTFSCKDGTACTGICMDSTNPAATTCDPNLYAEVYDDQNQTTYYSVRFVPDFADITATVQPGNAKYYQSYYSTGYQLVKLAAQQKANGTAVGIGAGAFLDILRGIYYYWETDPAINY